MRKITPFVPFNILKDLFTIIIPSVFVYPMGSKSIMPALKQSRNQIPSKKKGRQAF